MAGGPRGLTALPGGDYLWALLRLAGRQVLKEWTGAPPHKWAMSHPRAEGFLIAPEDPRPADPAAGRRMLAGQFELAGQGLAVGRGGEPWDRPSPSLRFAEALHRLDWLRDLMAAAPEGPPASLRLLMEWSRVFGGWNGFSWRPDLLGRRVFNLALAAPALAGLASDLEINRLAFDLARQARRLLAAGREPMTAANHAAAAALAGAVLSGRAGEGLLASGLKRLARVLPDTVGADGGHRSRCPAAALELYLDLKTLDLALDQRGLPPSHLLSGALDRLSGAVRFFTLADGRLPDLQGGEAGRSRDLAAAGLGAGGAVPAARNGFQRLEGRVLQVFVDAAPPARGPWSLAACAQPLAIEVLAHGRRLIVSCAWSPRAAGPQALRLADAASTLTLGDESCGTPMRGLRRAGLGARLVNAYARVEHRRFDSEDAVWLELSHDGWAPRRPLRHERRLYLDAGGEELRGEDRLTPLGSSAAAGERRFLPYLIRFHLHPDVLASLARDGHSVLLRPKGDEHGWWLRNDAREASVEPSVYFEDGAPKRSLQVVLRGQARLDAGARIRWKLAAAEGEPPH